MASNGLVVLAGTGGPPPARITLEVYRESTLNRTATMKVYAPMAIVAPNQLRFYPSECFGQLAYDEVVQPEVVRIGLRPGCTLSIIGKNVVAAENAIRPFEYVICGRSDSPEGLAAPYNEEETKMVMHLEQLELEGIFEFWQRNQNSDQVSHRKPGSRLLEPRS